MNMNIEELRLIVETVKSLSGDASSAFLWWLIFDMAKYLLAIAAGVSVPWMVIKALTGTSEWAEAGKRVARAYGDDDSQGLGMYSSGRKAIDKAIQGANRGNS